MNKLKICTAILIISSIIIINSCATPFDYTAFKESRPRSILVMPVANRSMDVMAPATYLSTSVYPLAESGYYVIPVALSEEMFKQNGYMVADEAHTIEYEKLYEIFHADAALYIVVTKFGISYRITASVAEAEANVRLIDLRTGLEIWSGSAYAYDNSGATSSSGSLAGMLISAAVNQAVNVLSNKAHEVGRKANRQMLTAGYQNGILYGPYHPKYGTD